MNVFGCFLFGLVWALSETRLGISPEVRIIVLTGFMGAFTTFSTFMFETHGLIADSQWVLALANVFGQTLVGFCGIVGGMALARTVQ